MSTSTLRQRNRLEPLATLVTWVLRIGAGMRADLEGTV